MVLLDIEARQGHIRSWGPRPERNGVMATASKASKALKKGDIIAFMNKGNNCLVFKIMISPTECFYVDLKDLGVATPSFKEDADGPMAGHIKLGHINLKTLVHMGLKHKATDKQLGIKPKKVKKVKQVWTDGY
jgi:hypothetical protein